MMSLKDHNEHMEHLRKVFEVLRQESLFGTLRSVISIRTNSSFLVLWFHNIELEVNKRKIEAIKEWYVPINVSKVRSSIIL